MTGGTAREWFAENVELADGRLLHVRTWPGAGRPLVLLHGLLSSSRGWHELVAATTRPCIAPDLPGFGRSGPAKRPLISAYADDVVCALRYLDVASLTLIGHSFGGAVATAVAERMPDRVIRLVLCAPAGFGRLHLAELAALPILRGLALGVAPCVERLPSGNGIDAQGGARALSGSLRSVRLRPRSDRARLRPGVRAAVEALAVASRSPQAFFRRAVDYRGPVSAVWGDQDGLIPLAHSRGLRTALPQTIVSVWDGVGHHPHRDRPGALAALVERRACLPEVEPVCDWSGSLVGVALA